MNRPIAAAILVSATILAGPGALAQTTTQETPPKPAGPQTKQVADHGFIYVNGGYQVTSTDFTRDVTFRVYAEDGSFDTAYRVKSGPQFNVGGGFRIWRNLAAGVSVSRFTRSGGAQVQASIPHPFFFNRPRAISGQASLIRRDETAVHVQGMVELAMTGKMRVSVFGGPSYFSVKQTLVTAVDYSESYPYDTATFSGARSEQKSKSAFGFNLGADVAFMFSRNIGVGALLQFSRASVKIPALAGENLKVDAGGGQVGAGLRLRF